MKFEEKLKTEELKAIYRRTVHSFECENNPLTDEEKENLIKILTGEKSFEQAIKETDRKYGKMCFKVAKNLLSNNEDSEECVNDTYLTVWNKIPPTRPNNFTAFICKITRNLSLKRLEVLSAKKRSAFTIVSMSEIEEALPDYNIAQGVEDEELGKLISKFLWSEKELDRNVFLRKYWFFDSISDIAERYSMNENSVKSMLFRSRNRLRDFLRKEGIEV